MDIEQYTDQQIVKGILDRDTQLTKEYLYKKCYPLFNAVYFKYYTDCENVYEFINEIYVYILTPNKLGVCKLADFKFRCTLTIWLKIVSEHFCHQLFKRKLDLAEKTNDNVTDINSSVKQSLDIDFNSLNVDDVYKILNMMPNKRYSKIIELRYIKDKSNEETALLLDMSMANYYNKHKLAKAQFCNMLKKEGLL